MSKPTDTSITLGDKLKPRFSRTLAKSLLALGVSVLIAIMVWWALHSPVAGFVALILCRFFFGKLLSLDHQNSHFLIHADQQGFMKSLKLADKTALFDGSNIYHLGLEYGFGAKPLAAVVQGLRTDGYRIVCFFDANIYFTLLENGAFQKTRQRFSVQILQAVFGLEACEIYVVPRAIQADRFIVESLSQLPVSFAVTNDQFRDYGAKYGFLRVDGDWRKGVEIKGGSVILKHYSLKASLR